LVPFDRLGFFLLVFYSNFVPIIIELFDLKPGLGSLKVEAYHSIDCL